jgi:hypothetical protein
LAFDEVTFADGTTDQDVPSHRSISVCVLTAPDALSMLAETPTAQQSDAELHVTP